MVIVLNKVTDVLNYLINYEKTITNPPIGKIDENTGIFTCIMDYLPIIWKNIDLTSTNTHTTMKHRFNIRNVCDDADILHSIRIEGTFLKATLFQRDNDCPNYVYNHHESSLNEKNIIMIPFPTSGIPLLHIGTPIYLEIYPDPETNEYPKVSIALGFVDTTTRRKFNISDYRLKEIGISVIHHSGKIFTCYGIMDYGYSPNCLVHDSNI